MSVGILIISHNGIGAAIYGTATFMIQNSPLNIKLLSADRGSDPDELLEVAKQLIRELDTRDGVLVLTDLLGSTPSNVAHRLHEYATVNIVTGLNLSMLIRVLNYPNLNLAELTDKAYSGGIDGVVMDHHNNH